MIAYTNTQIIHASTKLGNKLNNSTAVKSQSNRIHERTDASINGFNSMTIL